MKIYYQDDDIIVCIKPAGAVSTDEPGGMPGLIREAIGGDPMVRTVHRLDSVVSGLMVYALSKEAASDLSTQMEDGSFGKEYLAVVEGSPEKPQGQWKDYLSRNKRERKTYVSDRRDRNAQEAILTYRVCGSGRDVSLVKVKLITGRTHQIRCQFSSRQLPLYGDRKYGSSHGDVRIALWSHHLSFRHPITGRNMDFKALPPARIPWTFFRGYTETYKDGDLEVEYQRSETFSDCPYAEDCGFCAYQGMEYEKQLEKKQRKSSRWIRELGPVEPILPMEEPFGYRSKMTVDFGKDRNGKLITGIYSRRAHRVLRIGRCRIDHPKFHEILGTIRMLLIHHGIAPYDEKEQSGWLRQVTLRITSAGEVMVIFSAADQQIPEVSALVEELMEKHPEIRSILLRIMTKGKNAKGELHVLGGEDHLEEMWMGQHFRVGADSFFPLNPAQSQKVCETALSYANLTGEERVLDVSCGTGVLTLAAASGARRILAVDASDTAVREAEARAQEAQKENIRFICREPENYLAALAGSEPMDVVFLEASRCREPMACMKALEKLQPKRIVYIGKDPERAGQELKSLCDRGYRMEKGQSVDLLPFTDQVEIVALLTLEEPPKG